MKRALGASVLLLVGPVLLACDAPHATCPGSRVADLALRAASAADAGTCPRAGDGSLSFGATLTDPGDGGALLCLDRAEAQPLTGTRDGNHVIVASTTVPATVSGCGCATQVTETLEGDLAGVDGAALTFQGQLRDALAPVPGTDPATCQPAGDGGATCALPCTVVWQITSAP